MPVQGGQKKRLEKELLKCIVKACIPSSCQPTTDWQIDCIFLIFRPLITEEDLKMLFSSNGGMVKGFKFFQ